MLLHRAGGRGSRRRPHLGSGAAFLLRGRGGDLVLLALLLAPLLAAGAACEGRAQGEPVVLTIGPREVRMGELERAFWEKRRTDKSIRPDSAGLRRFLPGYIDNLIWQEVARRELPELEPVARLRLDEFREQKAIEMLRNEEYVKKSRASESEVRAAYEKLGRLLRLRMVTVATKKGAEEIMDAVRQGAVFAKVAEHESLDERTRGQGGDLGFLTYYDLDAEMRDRVFTLNPGDLAGPIPWNQQWQVFQIVEEKANPARGTLDSERAHLQQGLSMSRIVRGRREFVEGLFRRYRLELDQAEVAWMTAFLREETANVPRNLGDRSQAELEDPEIREKYTGNPFSRDPIQKADSARVLATFEDPTGGSERVVPILVIDQLLTDAPFSWPTFEKTADVEGLIRELVLERLEVGEAEKRRYAERPEVQALLREKEGEIRARYFFRTRLRPRAKPSPEEVRAYYDEHPEEFHLPEQRRFLALASSSLETARRIREMFLAGKPPTEIRSLLLNEDPGLTGTGDSGTPLYARGQSPALDPFLFRLPLGGVSEPIPFEGRHTVAKVAEIVPGKSTPFEEVSENLSVRLNTQRTEALQRSLVEEGRVSFPVRIDEQALRRLRFERPTEGD